MGRFFWSFAIFLFFVSNIFLLVSARRARSSILFRYSRYSYTYRAPSSTSSRSYVRYTYRYSRSYDTYTPSSVIFTPTTYRSSYYSPSRSSSYSYYTGLYYSYYYYTYYSYYYGGTCTLTSYGGTSRDSCSMGTTTTSAPSTVAPAPITCDSGVTLSDSVGWFNSHNAYGASAYTNSMTCSWILSASPGNIIQLSFVAFNTEKTFDIVRVYDGASSSATLLASFDGSSSSDAAYPGSSVLYSSGSYMFVTFTSDTSNTRDGFRALYQQTSSGNRTSSATLAATTSTTADPTVTYCSGELTLASNSTVPIVSHSSSSGLLPTSTSGLPSYHNNMNCTWLLPGRSGHYLQFYVAFMSLENCYDKVTIYEQGQSASSGRVFCDASTPFGYSAVTTLTTLGAGGVVTFRSDATVARQGFLITYAYVISYDTSLLGLARNSSETSESDMFTSSNVCRNYQVNANGSAMGSFTCPNPFEPADFTHCCGDDDMQYCCKIQDNTPMIAGIIIGIVLLIVVLVVIVYCCVRGCRERAAKKSGSAVKWRRTMNKARAVTAWRLMLGGGGGNGNGRGNGGGGGSSSGGGSSGGGVSARFDKYAEIGADASTFSPPPMPPPSALYYGAYPPESPPAYATVYPPKRL